MPGRDRPAPDRRAWLAAVAAGLTAGWTASAADRPTVEAIDAHTHFYDPTRPEGVPWPGKGDPRLYRKVLPDEFRRLTAPQRVVGTVVVEASPWVEDNQWLLDLAKRDTFLLGVVGRLDPNAETFPRLLARFCKDPLYRGIRIGPAELSKAVEQAPIRKNLALLAEQNRELDVNGGPAILPDVARLAAMLPELRIVVNHGANVTIDGKAPPAAYVDGLRAAAAGKQVFCKVSALVEGVRRPARDVPRDTAFYRPVLDALWKAFGPDRLIYASNWPVSDRAAPYATVYGIAHAYFKDRGAGVLEKFLAGNARRAYQLAPRK